MEKVKVKRRRWRPMREYAYRKAILEVSDRLTAVFFPDQDYVVLIFHDPFNMACEGMTFDQLFEFVAEQRKRRDGPPLDFQI
jgi:hypothetical protein